MTPQDLKKAGELYTDFEKSMKEIDSATNSTKVEFSQTSIYGNTTEEYRELLKAFKKVKKTKMIKIAKELELLGVDIVQLQERIKKATQGVD